MLTVTPEAESWITDQLSEAKAPEGVALRLYDKEGEIRMGVSEPKEEDQTFTNGDERVYLAIAPDAASKLDGKALCCQETAQGLSLAIAAAPPNA